jgi:hypothetical protein
MTSPMDHNPLLTYLQAWRQLLEASAALTSGWPTPPPTSGISPMFPGMSPMLPGMPSMPPMPGMPSGVGAGAVSPPPDYAQQLFGYLQAWRQHLEDAVSNASGATQPLRPTTPPMTPAHSAAPNPTGSPTGAAQPAQSASSGSQSDGSSGGHSSGSASTGPKNKAVVFLRPRDSMGTITDLNRLPGEDLFGGPEYPQPTAPQRRSLSSGSAFASKVASATSSAASPSQPRSLFSSGSANTSTPTVSQANQDSRRAAPPATSRWWEAGQGQRPGFAAARPPAQNLINLRPLDLGGKEQ